MMYLSTLLIDTGSNPDRPRPGRLWLRNMYRVHQRLCMAFPSTERKGADEKFLKPYTPMDFPETRHVADEKPESVGVELLRHVHTKRNDESGFLFRVDTLPGSRVVIVVLSALAPDWKYAFRNTPLLVSASEPREFALPIEKGETYRFRLVANPTLRLAKGSVGSDGNPVRAEWIGKRVPAGAHPIAWLHWLGKKSLSEDRSLGFQICSAAVVQSKWIQVNKTTEAKNAQRLLSVQFDGVLEVTDVDAFRKTLACGIGPAKAFGFGLLSVAPV